MPNAIYMYNFQMSWVQKNDDKKSGMRFLAWKKWKAFEDHDRSPANIDD